MSLRGKYGMSPLLKMLLRHRKKKCFFIAFAFCCGILVLLYIWDYYGLSDVLYETSFSDFAWPLNINLAEAVRKIQNNEKLDIAQINPFPFKIRMQNENLCKDVIVKNSAIFVLIVVKSACWSFESRHIIRKSWGNEKTISVNHSGTEYQLVTKRVFLIGHSSSLDSQYLLREEYQMYKDLIQGDFEDGYFNNTYKTMMAFSYASLHCHNAHFAFFVDEDFYISKRNTAQFLASLPATSAQNLYIGFSLFTNTRVNRNKKHKRYVPLAEYPYSRIPPYVYAGAYILSMKNIRDMSVAMHYVKFFRMDDVYLGLIAYRLGITISDGGKRFLMEFYTSSDVVNSHVIASHGFRGKMSLMREFWDLAAET
ncbi:beta-1,3-galactosyltransferase brn isoform X2 [Lingula anatina]|nr:beta-1,3-galactosyltransferase brn isoform X2 [Lingula anatina]XP_013420348.1 beta-1,3-galactosyltransferase brn isoform X2 [Lingula anatina]XP_013420350.1 beta-1,3-galactosyltransferase brn isoform X2 [Lingula anatina]XP_013420351.1 beta-1,3-galactosyltransferase brn isoform X2 [Lingula anatina]XP_023932142.1 beta-1,3-galactosyltransferase brn isoform X2 [Lingula anatina]XP_023932143.1 beta-1,3-galactosyltransferase brn isoform X2 [Lingula anatina]|eukprot:XP_013420347.1 beta-1,3-galactosyltransferase brn isoform X2 [Lingula anatina]